MIVRVNKSQRVRRVDALNWIIEELHIKGEDSKDPGAEVWRPRKGGAYFTRVEGALSSLLKSGIEADGEMTLAEAVEHIEAIARRHVIALEAALRGEDVRSVPPPSEAWREVTRG